MTFSIFGSECAPGILDIDPAAEPGIVLASAAAIDLVRLFELDRRPLRSRLACHWLRQLDGRLACTWAPDIVPLSRR
jgi:hypothetical protein